MYQPNLVCITISDVKHLIRCCQIGILGCAKPFLGTPELQSTNKAFIRSSMEYCSPFWTGSPTYPLNQNPKSWYFLHPLNHAAPLPKFYECIHFVHLCIPPYPSSLLASLICPSPSTFSLHPAVGVFSFLPLFPLLCCSDCVLHQSTSPSREYVC